MIEPVGNLDQLKRFTGQHTFVDPAAPIGYQTNTYVYSVGGYRFSDFVRAGSPLVLLLWVGFSLFAPWYYGLW